MPRPMGGALPVLAVGAAVLPASAARPEIAELKTCRVAEETEHAFEAAGLAASFTVDDEFIYFIAKVRVPRDAAWRAYRARPVWRSPDGSAFRVREDLERGYIWSLRDRLPVRGSPAAGLPGTWRIVLSISFGPSRSATFTLVGRSTSAAGDGLPADSAPVEGREREPNDTAATANLLTHDSPVQGELRYFSAAVFDQDWFVVRLAEGRRAWPEVNPVGSTSGG